jgi:acetyl esterase/lipase
VDSAPRRHRRTDALFTAMNTPSGETWIGRTRQVLDFAQEHLYKETEDGLELHAYIFSPETQSTELRPAILFFASGLWENMSVTQFAPQCLHFTRRGALTVLLEYRVRAVHGTGPLQAMSDARSAIRWVRYNAEALRIDPTRVVAAGGSAGAHLALSAALIPGVADDPNDPNISCVPDAMALFCPIVDTTKPQLVLEKFTDPEEASRCNPSRHVGKHLPPTIIFHGTEDRVIPYEPVVRFVNAVKKKANLCELCLFKGRDHSFYNFNVNPEGYDTTVAEMDRFLVAQGFLPEPVPSEEDAAASW